MTSNNAARVHKIILMRSCWLERRGDRRSLQRIDI